MLSKWSSRHKYHAHNESKIVDFANEGPLMRKHRRKMAACERLPSTQADMIKNKATLLTKRQNLNYIFWYKHTSYVTHPTSLWQHTISRDTMRCDPIHVTERWILLLAALKIECQYKSHAFGVCVCMRSTTATTFHWHFGGFSWMKTKKY